jgi:SAM-dependent methyltransferase
MAVVDTLRQRLRGRLEVLGGVAERRGWGPEGLAATVAVPPRRPGRVALNGLCHTDDWKDDEWRRHSRALHLPQEDGYYHRKAWEWTQCVYGLETLGALGPATIALGVGAGHECVLYYLANRTSMTVGTDLYAGDFTTSHAAEADPDFLRDPARFAPFPFAADHLRALPADGCALPFPNGTFDVVYSLSSIEHFGGHARAADAMREIRRVLRPGGVACVATELIIDGGPHPEYFTWDDLDRWVIRPSGMVLAEDVRRDLPPRKYLDDPVRLPEEYLRTPHVVLAAGTWTFTSVCLFLIKPTRAQLWQGARRRATAGLTRRVGE